MQCHEKEIERRKVYFAARCAFTWLWFPFYVPSSSFECHYFPSSIPRLNRNNNHTNESSLTYITIHNHEHIQIKNKKRKLSIMNELHMPIHHLIYKLTCAKSWNKQKETIQNISANAFLFSHYIQSLNSYKWFALLYSQTHKNSN